jgi:uncharacterized damage-inducible protein DinB
MKSFFKELFEYSHHFNQKLGDVIENTENPSEKMLKLYNHTINAHQIWNNRIERTEAPLGVWDIHSIQNCKIIDKKNFDYSLQLLHNSDLETLVNYTNTQGHTFNSSIKDIFFHIINHSTYHRAQIQTELKNLGLQPLNSDYIFYKR